MWTESEIFLQDLQAVAAATFIPWDKLENKTIFVTGATGLIGQTLISALLYYSMVKHMPLKVLALVRDREKAERIFARQLKDCGNLFFVEGTVEQLPEIAEEVHYIVHGASPTASLFFAQQPVDTIKTAVLGTMHVLELAKEKQVKGVVYLSSMEVYGSPTQDTPLREKDVDYMNPLLVRNCYPESKRLCETLCASYFAQYRVPTTAARLSQTFGPGVEPSDNRVFAQFARCVQSNEDIVLLTTGESKRTYVYTMDAISALLTILLNGVPGECYNVSNMDTYCSVYEMAQMAAKELAQGRIEVKICVDSVQSVKFSPPHKYYLDNTKLRGLGWKATVPLQEMYLRMMEMN